MLLSNSAMLANMTQIIIGSIFLAVFLAVAALPAAGQSRAVVISLRDENGLEIARASASVTAGSTRKPCAAIADGFFCEISGRGDVLLEVSAQGFAPYRQIFKAGGAMPPSLEIILAPAPVGETVVITAARIETRVGDVPASVVTLGRREIASTAAPTLDDALRQIPGFSIFRRSSSRTANPTAQGVSLRGTGASGASRSVVLFDGVPLNDAFGGWVQWNRIPPAAVERAEVLRGGASALYGSASLSGAVNIIPRTISEALTFSGEIYGGTQRTASGSGLFGGKIGAWGIDVTAANFQNRGYLPVDADERGPVDSFAGVRTASYSGRVSRNFGDAAEMFFRPMYFGEARSNGTGLQTNRTHSRQYILGGRFSPKQGDTGDAGIRFDWRVYGGTQVFDQIFSAVAAGRKTENLTRIQRSPSQNIGFSGQFTSAVRNHTFAAGVELREVRGASDEIGFFGGNAASRLGAGGRETSFGVYAGDFISVGASIVISGGIRFDTWANSRALLTTLAIATGQTAVSEFPDRSESSTNPRIAVLYRLSDRVSFYAAASRSFRAPTLNELYRGFRVGDVVTSPNAVLKAEISRNYEGGASISAGRTYIRASFFETEIDRAIANVTVSSSPGLIMRQRQNAGSLRMTGFEADAETRFGRVAFSGGYLYSDSRIDEFPSNPILVGKAVPQVPRHHYTVQARYTTPTWSLAFQGRGSGQQYDDDLNFFRLEKFFQADILGSRRLGENYTVFAAIENIFNSRYSIGRTPVRTVSSPTNFRIGVRWD